MAFKPEEIKHLETLSEEMVKLIGDRDTTSGEASVIYSKIGNICTRALAGHAATVAKRETRTQKASKFQIARQARRTKDNTSQTQTKATV